MGPNIFFIFIAYTTAKLSFPAAADSFWRNPSHATAVEA